MSKLQLSTALLANERTLPIINGTVEPDGIDLAVTVGTSPGEMIWRQLAFKEFDVSELSLTEMMMLISQGDDSWVLLPVFLTRRFFHTEIFVHADSDIKRPQDLRDRKVGVPEFSMTGALWARGVLKDDYGVLADDIDWYQERSGAMCHAAIFGAKPRVSRFQFISQDKTIGSMMVAGELDAAMLYIGVRTLTDRSTIKLRQNPAFRPLFPSPRDEILRYVQKTGLSPFNHAIAVRRSIVERHPWVALNLYNAFVAAKKFAAARIAEQADLQASLGWLTAEARAALDRDPFPYGVASNRRELETCERYAFEEGLSSRRIALDEMFAPSTMEF